MRPFWITVVVCTVCGIGATLLTEAYLSARISLIGSFLGLEPSFNEGIAWGFKLPGLFQPVLIGIALMLMGWLALRVARSRISQIGFGLILGGGIANVIDRLMDGAVTDVFQVGSFPVFNVADSCITVGIGLLLLEMAILRNSGSVEQ